MYKIQDSLHYIYIGLKNIHIYNLKINLVISIHTNLTLCSTTLTEVKSIY